MSVDIYSEEGQIIRQLIPLSTLSINRFESLCNKITVEKAKPGTFLFKKNDTTSDLIYLIDGSVTLQSDELNVETIVSGTESSRFALAHQIPRKIDALTNTTVRFLRLNSDSIQAPPINSSKEDTNFMVFDEEAEDKSEDEDDWITTLLKSSIFRALPPANLQQMIMGLDQICFAKGESIVKQGDLGDSFYIIIKGQCQVSRKPSINAKDIILAQLRTQDTFGEDSLLTGEPRNVTITALTNTKLLKLSKEKFISLVKEPTLKFIPHAKIEDELDNGAIFLDVRPPDEYKKFHLPNSTNTPFFSLRMHLKKFEKKSTIIVICADGKVSEAAAFLLLRSKFKALIVEGGIENVPKGNKVSSVVTDIADLGESKQNPMPNVSIEEKNQQNTLKLENERLKMTIQKLSKEKNELETQYRNLYKQTERLKSILDSLKNNSKPLG